MVRWSWLAAASWLLSTTVTAQVPDPLAGWNAPPIDFSHAGYLGGGVLLPQPLATILVAPGPGDDTDRVMAAVRQVE
ncbi:MAG: hypothetical protein DCE92_10825, partial [Alphaproteobacteria bacterium]